MRAYALHTLEGVRDCDITTHPFTTADGLGLSMLRFRKSSSKDVVLVIHGLTTSTDMFIMPEHRNLVTCLHDAGFGDVWCLDFRMSNRHPYNMTRHRYTMDHCALFDHPEAVRTLRKAVGDDARLHVIAHCLGAMSFSMALFSGQIPGIRSAIMNSVSLTPRVAGWSRFKLRVAPFMVESVINQPYVSPDWGSEPGITPGKLVSKVVNLFHEDCGVPSCHMLSFMWGTGWPALYRHENLLDVTHRRGGDLYGPTSPNYHRHVRKMVQVGHAVKYDPADPLLRALPNDYLAGAASCTTPVLFVTGRHNHIFEDSNIACFRELDARRGGLHALEIFEEYGHQDVFMGKAVDKDVFPRLIAFLHSQAC